MKKGGDDSLKKELDRGNNFVDYFVLIGLNKSLIFSDWLYETDLDSLNSSEKLNPEILSKFPPFDKTTINIDENMIRVKLILF
jgi:hypothetical protein